MDVGPDEYGGADGSGPNVGIRWVWGQMSMDQMVGLVPDEYGGSDAGSGAR